MEKQLNINDLEFDIKRRFGKDVSSSDFGLVGTNLREIRGENISFLLQHYSGIPVFYKFFFNSFIAFELRDEMLAQEYNVQDIKFDENYNGIIIHRILDGTYLNFLKKDLSLKLYDNIDFFNGKEIQQYNIYEQNLVIDVVTTAPPDIILIENKIL